MANCLEFDGIWPIWWRIIFQLRIAIGKGMEQQVSTRCHKSFGRLLQMCFLVSRILKELIYRSLMVIIIHYPISEVEHENKLTTTHFLVKHPHSCLVNSPFIGGNHLNLYSGLSEHKAPKNPVVWKLILNFSHRVPIKVVINRGILNFWTKRSPKTASYGSYGQYGPGQHKELSEVVGESWRETLQTSKHLRT